MRKYIIVRQTFEMVQVHYCERRCQRPWMWFNTEWQPFSREEWGPAPVLRNKNHFMPTNDKEWRVRFNDAVNQNMLSSVCGSRTIYTTCADRAIAEWRHGKIHSTIDEENMNPCHKVHDSSHVGWTGNRKDEGQIYCVTFTSHYFWHKWNEAYIESRVSW